jgi:hypothetical protein
MPNDCPDPNENLQEAIDIVQETYVDSQIDALKNIGNNLDDSVNNIPADKPAKERLHLVCVAVNASFDKLNSLRHSCNFDPTGCLRQVMGSGILDSGNPAASGAALAGAIFIDAVTGNFEPPLQVSEPSLETNVSQPTPYTNIDLPEIPAPPPSDECPDPVADLNTALESAENTFADLHGQAAKKLSDDLSKSIGDLDGLPTNIKANALCTTINAGFDVASGIVASCNINVGECLEEVLESGILGSDPKTGAAALAAALFLDASSGSTPNIG